jgi:alanyl-tRNA synthetase
MFVETQGLSSQEMKGQLDVLKKETQGKDHPSSVIAMGQVEEGRTTLILGSTDSVWDVNQLLQTLLSPWGGKGGGRSDLAQGGWAEGPSLSEAIEELRYLLKQEPPKKS